MPTYLLHGFRWPRPFVRIHIILQNLDDAAAEWLVAPRTSTALLRNLNELYPDTMEHLANLRFIEQYDPNDLSAAAASQPYAYVADRVEEVRLGVAVDDVVSQGIGNESWAAIAELRDKLAPEEMVGWFVVVCGDQERLPPTPPEMLGSSGPDSTSSPERNGNGRDAHHGQRSRRTHASPDEGVGTFKKFFGSVGFSKRKSMSMTELLRSKSYHELSQNAPEPIIGTKPILPHLLAEENQSQTDVTNGRNSGISSNERSSNISSNSNGKSSRTSNGHSVSPPLPEQKPDAHDAVSIASAPAVQVPSGMRTSRRATMGHAPDAMSERSVALTDVPTRFNPEPETKARTRRHSNQPALPKSLRTANPEGMRRAYSPPSTARNGGSNSIVSPIASPVSTGPYMSRSPVSTLRHAAAGRSASPLRSELVSPVTASRGMSPASTIRKSRPLSPVKTETPQTNGHTLSQPQQSSQAAQQNEEALRALLGETPQNAPPKSTKSVSGLQKPKQRLSLVTQTPAPPSVPEEDEMEEVIALSPAARSPIVSYRRSRSSLALAHVNGSSTSLHLSGLNLTSKHEERPYFGQQVGSMDLVAEGLEDAFDKL